MPNNKCAVNIDHHDHESEIQHLHQHNVGHIQSAKNILSSNTTYDTIISNILTNSSKSSELELYFTNTFINANKPNLGKVDETEIINNNNSLNNSRESVTI